MDRRRARATLTAAFALATLLGLLLHAREYQFLTDDSYISFRYARNLAEGHGLVFNPGFERVEGYTNLLWVLVLAAGPVVGVAPEAAAIGLGYGLTVVLWALVCWFAYGEARSRNAPWLCLLAPTMLVATRSVAVWSTGGLETRLFEVLVLGALLRQIVEVRAVAHDPIRPVRHWAAALFSLATLTRPDALLIAGCSMTAAWGWLAVRRFRRGQYSERVRADLRHAGADAVI